jgi:hypothetical protein
MSTIDSDLTDEERAKLRAAAGPTADANADPKPASTADEVMKLIQELPDVDIIPSDQLTPVFELIARCEPLLRDQLAAILKAKIRGLRARTIDEEIDKRLPDGATTGAVADDDASSDVADDDGEISDEAIARTTRRCMEAGRPAIFCTDDESKIVNDAINAIAKCAPWIFARDGKLVQVRKGRIVELTEKQVRYTLGCVATFVDATTQKLKVIRGVPNYVDAMVHQRGYYPDMRELAGVATTPILHADGSVFAEPLGIDRETKQLRGYDATTRKVYRPTHAYPPIPEAAPTRAEAIRAAFEVMVVFNDFPFRTPADRAAALALVVTLIGRHLVDGSAPGFVAEANIAGAGKGKLVKTCAAIAYGKRIADSPKISSEEELEKRVITFLRAGLTHIPFDNVDKIGGGVLDALLTSDRFLGRRFGTHDMLDLDAHVTITVTGNNLTYEGDAKRRVLPIRMLSDEARPEERSGFAYGLPNHAIEHHVRLHCAALTVLRYGLGLTGPVPTWGSYEAWCEVIRRTVIEVTGVDPCDTRIEVAKSDLAGESLVALIEALEAHQVGRTWTSTQILTLVRGERQDDGRIDVNTIDPVVAEAIGGLLGEARPSTVAIGRELAKYQRRVVEMGDGGQARIVRAQARTNMAMWCIERL